MNDKTPEQVHSEAFRLGYEHRREEEGGRPPEEGLTVEEVKRMSADEINARWDEVAAVLERAGR